MTTCHDGVLARIKKLLRLAQSSNANEAAVAAAQAQRLMDEHRIASVSIDDPDEAIVLDPEAIDGNVLRSLATWKRLLASILAERNGCTTLLHGGAIEAVGRPSDIAVFRYLYAFCAREIQRLTKRDTRGRGQVVANNFRAGCTFAIRDALDADREATAQVGSTALVLVNQRHRDAEAHADTLVTGPARRAPAARKSREGLHEGYETAQREIDLRRGIGTGAVPESRQLTQGGAT